ncbi:unnamed protein product, partial [Phaeothamnion confervicola]
NAARLVAALRALRMDMGLVADDVLKPSGRDMVLLVLHLFQDLPQMVPRAEVEFCATLGLLSRKCVELRNPGTRPVEYNVTVAGSPDFRLPETRVTLPPGGAADFVVELMPRFTRPVTGRLTFWATR